MSTSTPVDNHDGKKEQAPGFSQLTLTEGQTQVPLNTQLASRLMGGAAERPWAVCSRASARVSDLHLNPEE